MTGLPFVYAAWTGRPGAVTGDDVGRCRRRRRRASRRSTRLPPNTGAATRAATARAAAYLRDNVKYGLGPRGSRGTAAVPGLRRGSRPGARRARWSSSERAKCLCSRMMIEQIATEGAATAAASTRPRRWRCIATRRRICSARSPTRFAPASIPERIVTYIIDRNVNYTNVCVARCNFCAFYRPVGVSDGYVLGFEEIFRKIDETIAVGGNQLLLQGGHNPDLPIQWYEDLFRAVKARYPDFKLHALSPPEVLHISRLNQLADAGGDRAAGRRGPRQHSRRRRRDPRRSRPQAAELLHARRRPTNGSTSCARRIGRPAHDGDDDVRDGGDRRGAHRAHDAAARSAGRDRRLHGVHHLELPARAHRARRLRGDRHRLPAHAGARAHRARQLRQPAGVVGDAGRQGRAAQPRLRRQRHGQRDDRGERRARGRRELLHGRGRDRRQRRGRRLHRRSAATCTTRSSAIRSSASATCRACCRWRRRAPTATRRCPRS